MPLDYESVKDYIMAIKAEDRTSNSRSESRNAIINVLDAQDQPPVLIGSPYSFFPYEEQPVVSMELNTNNDLHCCTITSDLNDWVTVLVR